MRKDDLQPSKPPLRAVAPSLHTKSHQQFVFNKQALHN